MKRFYFIFLVVLSLVLCTGWTIDGGAFADYWSREWYGWYEVTDATGVYAELVGIREDCIASSGGIIDAHLGGTEGVIYFYDQNHYKDPFFSFDAAFSYYEVRLTNGFLDGEKMAVCDLTILGKKEIKVDNAFWGEGTIGNADGTMTLRMFFMPWDMPDAWAGLKEERGILELSDAELLPEHFSDVYLPYLSRNSNMDCSMERYFSGFHHPIPEDTMQICWAKDHALRAKEDDKPAPVSFLRLDHSKDFTQIVIENRLDICNFEFLTLTEGELDAQGNMTFLGERQYQEDEVLRNHILVVQLEFHGDLPEYAIRLEDFHGREYFYIIEISGRDGSVRLIKTEDSIAKRNNKV